MREVPNRQIDLVYERQWSSLGNVIHALSQMKCLGRLYGGFPKFRYVRGGIPTEIVRTYPVAALWNFGANKLHLPRWSRLEEPRWVGNWVARQKDLAPVIWANGTAHRFLFPKLKSTGRILILERGSTHPETLFLQPELARKEAGYPYRTILPPEVEDEVSATHLADGILAASEHVRQTYIERGFAPEKVHNCSFGINPDHFPFVDRQVPKRRPIRVLTVGIIGFRKGLHRLLKLGEWATVRGIPIELHLVGPIYDPEANEMLATTSASVILHGTLKGQSLQTVLAQADIYALPAYEEGLPFSVLEAMSSGLPALVSNDTGAREPVTHMQSGFILERFEEDEFDIVLKPFLSDPGSLIEMGKAARGRILGNYTVAHYFERLSRALERISAISSSNP